MICSPRRNDATALRVRGGALAGKRLEFDFLETLGRRLRTMNILEDSSYYQVLLKEGREIGRKEGKREGRIKGMREGRIEGMRETFILVGQDRFGRLPRATRAAIEAIDDPDRLLKIAGRFFSAASWDDLLSGEHRETQRVRSPRR